jgi:glycosyltransferase involved in cell wall biosynthesis
VYSTGGEGPLAGSMQAGGIRVILPPQKILRALFGHRIFRLPIVAVHLMWALIKGRFAIVHFFLPEAYLVGAPLALMVGPKLRIMSRRSLNAYRGKHLIAGFFERRLHSRMTAVLANSRSVARELETEGVNPDQLGLIYNGLDQEIRPLGDCDRSRRALKLRDTTLVLVIVANLIPYKGHLDLIEALGRIAERLPADWHLLIVGRDDGAAGAVEALSTSLGIADKITFLGARGDVPDLLNASNVGLLSSHEEGFSNAILEGMRAGLPMIVTDVGGNAEAVINEETGLVVPPRDPLALGNAILRLASDPLLRRAFGEKGRQRIEQYFTLQRCVMAYEAMYSELLAGKLPGDIEEIRYRPELNKSLARKSV